jgi:hypothetical protein
VDARPEGSDVASSRVHQAELARACLILLVEHLPIQRRDRHLADDVVRRGLVTAVDDVALRLEGQDSGRRRRPVGLRRQFILGNARISQDAKGELNFRDMVSDGAPRDMRRILDQAGLRASYRLGRAVIAGASRPSWPSLQASPSY